MWKVLYVEDDAINALIMRKFLDKHFDIFIAENADACQKLLSEKGADLILMDINLGNSSISGTELLHQIRLDNRYERIPVFAVTAFAMPNDRQRYLESGFDDYFSKPINRDQIIKRIQETLG